MQELNNDNIKKIVQQDKNPWINAWRDPLALFSAYSQNMLLCDVLGDGDTKLLIADEKNQLICYKGTSILWETQLSSPPISLIYFYPESSNQPLPIIAVGASSSVYFYKSMKAIFKWDLPKIEMIKQEKQLWESFECDASKLNEFLEKLLDLKKSGLQLSYKSLEIFNQTSTKKKFDLVKFYKSDDLKQVDNVTCMETIYLEQEDKYQQSAPIIGTEFKQLYILDPLTFKEAFSFQLRSTPIQMCIFGTLKEQYRIFVALRNNQIAYINNGKLEDKTIDLSSKPINLIRVGANLIVATMNDKIMCYNQKGVKQYQIDLNSPIVCIEKFDYANQKNLGILVSLQSEEIRIYKEKDIVYTLYNNGLATSMRFGVFGREEGSLVILYKNKGLDVKMLQRKFDFQNYLQGKNKVEKNFEEIPLTLPRKTKLFIEQTQRERDNPQQMHKCLQKDLMKLRLKTAQSYLQTMQEGNIPNRLTSESSLRLQANIIGIGPMFKVQFTVENSGSNPLTQLTINYQYDTRIFKVKDPVLSIPFLLPKMSLPLTLFVENIDESGTADVIKVLINDKKSQVPLIGAIIQMPMSELRQN